VVIHNTKIIFFFLEFAMRFQYVLSDCEAVQCRSFSESSSPTQNQQDFCVGGSSRTLVKIKADTFQGKIAEVVVGHFLNLSANFEVFGAGIGDACDFVHNGKTISVVSTKDYGKWMLVERVKLLRERADYYILVRVNEAGVGGLVVGFASFADLAWDDQTLHLHAGEFLPRTDTALKTDNYARHISDLKCSVKEWNELLH
jgi:hypothetical protein